MRLIHLSCQPNSCYRLIDYFSSFSSDLCTEVIKDIIVSDNSIVWCLCREPEMSEEEGGVQSENGAARICCRL